MHEMYHQAQLQKLMVPENSGGATPLWLTVLLHGLAWWFHPRPAPQALPAQSWEPPAHELEPEGCQAASAQCAAELEATARSVGELTLKVGHLRWTLAASFALDVAVIGYCAWCFGCPRCCGSREKKRKRKSGRRHSPTTSSQSSDTLGAEAPAVQQAAAPVRQLGGPKRPSDFRQ